MFSDLGARRKAAWVTKGISTAPQPSKSQMREMLACLPCRTSGTLVVPEPGEDGVQQIYQGHFVLCPHKGAHMRRPFTPITPVNLCMFRKGHTSPAWQAQPVKL